MRHFLSGILRDPEPESGGGGQAELFDDPAEQNDPPAADPGDDRLARLEKKLDSQNGFLANFFQRPQREPQQQRPDPNVQRKQFEDAFFQNPTGVTAHMATQAAQQQANQLRGELHPMQVRLAQDEARGKDPEVFDKYKDKVSEWVRNTYGPADWTNPFVWEQGLKGVKADHLDEIAEWKAQKKKAAASINAPSRRGFSGDEPKGLSDDERAMAEFLGMSDADYEDARKGWATDLSAPTTGRNMLKSGWSDVITLDSRKPRKRAKANA